MPYLASVDKIVIGARCCAKGRACLLHRLLSHDVPMTNIRSEPCARWMIALFMVMAFIIGVDRWCHQSFLLRCVSFFFVFFRTTVFGLVVVMDFLPSLACERQIFLVR